MVVKTDAMVKATIAKLKPTDASVGSGIFGSLSKKFSTSLSIIEDFN